MMCLEMAGEGDFFSEAPGLKAPAVLSSHGWELGVTGSGSQKGDNWLTYPTGDPAWRAELALSSQTPKPRSVSTRRSFQII